MYSCPLLVECCVHCIPRVLQQLPVGDVWVVESCLDVLEVLAQLLVERCHFGGQTTLLALNKFILRANQAVRKGPHQDEHHRVGDRLDRQALTRGQGQQNTGGQHNEEDSEVDEGPHFVLPRGNSFQSLEFH